MASFFVPSLATSGPTAEQAYLELRDQAEDCTGAVARDRRIEGLECRRSGRDCLLQVGETDAATGQTVAAIIQVGRGTYTVHHLSPCSDVPAEPVVLQQSEVYSITEFEQ